MGRWASMLGVLLAAVLVGPALAQGSSQMQVPPPGQPLRGPVQPDAAASKASGATGSAATGSAAGAATTGAAATGAPARPVFMTPLQSPAPRPASSLLGSTQDQALRQCKATCGRDYYACGAGESPAECSSTWSQCLAACGQADRRSRTLNPLGNP